MPAFRTTFLLMLAALSTIPTRPEPPLSKHYLYSPVAGAAEFDTWELVVASREALPQPAVITLFSADGQPHATTTISVGVNETKRLDLRDLMMRQSYVPLGGLAIEYFGHPDNLLAHVLLTGFHGLGSFDIPVLEGTKFKSNVPMLFGGSRRALKFISSWETRRLKLYTSILTSMRMGGRASSCRHLPRSTSLSPPETPPQPAFALCRSLPAARREISGPPPTLPRCPRAFSRQSTSSILAR